MSGKRVFAPVEVRDVPEQWRQGGTHGWDSDWPRIGKVSTKLLSNGFVPDQSHRIDPGTSLLAGL